jgi:hypothetical protein
LLPLALGALLAACSLPLTIPLPDQTVEVPALGDTAGKVVYPAKPQTFTSPGSVLKDVRVEGTLEASQPLLLTLDLYARTQDPAQDPNCQPLGDLTTPYAYACAVGAEDGPIGEASFQGTSTTSLSLNGPKLTEGLQQGRLWLGVKVQGLPAARITFTFKNLRATFTLGL